LKLTLPQALRAQGLLKEAEHVESQSAETVLTPDECQLLGYLDKGKRKRKEDPLEFDFTTFVEVLLA